MTKTTFIETSAHKRFVEFARTVCKDRTIGLCYGPAGVGKTLSARRYARWDLAEPLLESWGPRDPSDEKVYAALAKSRTVFYTPPVASAFAALRKDLNQLRNRVEACIDQALDPQSAQPTRTRGGHAELIIVDEAERLTNSALEFLRDQFDRAEIGLILIGMPGIEKRMSRYPQLYSRIGFAHPYPPLSRGEMDFILRKQWQKLGKNSTPKTSQMFRLPPRSPASQAATSVCCNACSTRSTESSTSTSCAKSPMTSSRPPPQPLSSERPINVQNSVPLTVKSYTRGVP